MLSKEVVEILRCPKCRGALVEIVQPAGLHCRGCDLLYPVLDGIPDLLIEDARPFHESDPPPVGKARLAAPNR